MVFAGHTLVRWANLQFWFEIKVWCAWVEYALLGRRPPEMVLATIIKKKSELLRTVLRLLYLVDGEKKKHPNEEHKPMMVHVNAVGHFQKRFLARVLFTMHKPRNPIWPLDTELWGTASKIPKTMWFVLPVHRLNPCWKICLRQSCSVLSVSTAFSAAKCRTINSNICMYIQTYRHTDIHTDIHVHISFQGWMLQ